MGALTLIRLDAILELISFFICAAISAGFIRAHLKLKVGVFLWLGAGFGLMAGAMLARSLYIILTLTVERGFARPLQPLLQLYSIELFYSIIRVSAYVLFIVAYLIPLVRERVELGLGAVPPLLVIYNSTFEIISAALLLYVVIVTSVNWYVRRSAGSSLIAAGFWALILSHVAFFLTPLSLLLYFLGHGLQLTALILLALGTVEAGRG
ncbi:MAG: hypothetical protein NZ957_01975 [Thaumarchaeota archaeon]|nr:hypothetical protein [Candidatus Calditenuaceae archaeon]